MSCASVPANDQGQEDSDIARILKNAEKALGTEGGSPQKKPGFIDPFQQDEKAFELEDDPKIEYDFELKEAPILDSLLTLTSVTTFLTGFVAADFSGFAFNDWQDLHWAFPFTYVCLVAFAEGACLYLSICGTMTGVAVQRAKNQSSRGEWATVCRKAVKPLEGELWSLKGKRLKAYAATYSVIAVAFQDWYHTYLLAGYAGTDLNVKTKFAEAAIYYRHVYVKRGTESQTYIVSFEDPAAVLGERLGFRYTRQYTFFSAIICYLIAQTLQALRGAPPNIIVTVAALAGLWLVQIGVDLRRIYAKIRD